MHSLVAWLQLAAAAAAVVVLTKVLPFLWRCRRAYKQFKASPVPGPPPSSAIVGNIPDIAGPKGVWKMAAWANTYGTLYKLQFLDQFTLILTDPDEISRITKRTGPAYMTKPRWFYEALEIATRPKVPNILTANDGDYNKAVRQGAAPCFSITNMKKVLPLVLELTKRVADHMAQQDLVDVTDGAKRITSDIMGVMLLGEDLGGTRWQPSEYLDVFYPVIQAQAELLNNPYHLWQLWRSDVRAARSCITRHDLLMDLKVAHLMKCPPADHTIAAHLLNVKDPATGKALSPAQLKAEIAMFMAAGFETTSHAITWNLTLMAAYPEVQEEVYKELVAAGIAPSADGSCPGRDFASSDLGGLPLLSAVIKESLRLCPPAPFGGSRLCPADGTDLCGYKVNKGTVVMICTLPLALSKHVYGPDAAEFRPSRWLKDMTGKSRSSSPTDDTQPQCDTSSAAAAGVNGSSPDPCTFLTGPRDCIGQNLAKLELQVVLSTLLARFKFSAGPELQKELAVAAATGQPHVSAVHSLAGVFVTLQPLAGKLQLRVEERI